MNLVRLHLVLDAEGLDMEALAKGPVGIVLRTTSGSVEREVLYTTEGFVERACLEQQDVASPGVAPVIQTIERAFRLQGRVVRQDVEVQVDPSRIGAAQGPVA